MGREVVDRLVDVRFEFDGALNTVRTAGDHGQPRAFDLAIARKETLDAVAELVAVLNVASEICGAIRQPFATAAYAQRLEASVGWRDQLTEARAIATEVHDLLGTWESFLEFDGPVGGHRPIDEVSVRPDAV